MRSILFWLLMSGLCGSAWANPFSTARYRGLRGGSTDQSGFSVYWNPAALATQEGLHIDIHAGGVRRSAVFDRDAVANNETEPSNAGKGETGALGVVPSLAASWSLHLSDDWDLGLGMGAYIARAGLSNWKRHPEAAVENPGAYDGPQRWGTLSTQLLILSPSLGIGVHHRPTGLSFGIAPVYNLVSLSLTKARNPDKSTTLRDIEGRLAEGRILLEDATSQALTWIVGARWDVSKALAFALTWHQGVVYEVEGTSFIQFGTAPESKTRARFPLQVADSIRFGSDIEITSWLTLRPEVEWAGWSIMDRQDAINLDDPKHPVLMEIERGFEDTWALRLRGDFSISQDLMLHGGLEYETAATPETAHEPGLAESASAQFGAGASLILTPTLRVTTTFIWHQFADVTVTESTQIPTMNGHYTDNRQYLTVDLEFLL